MHFLLTYSVILSHKLMKYVLHLLLLTCHLADWKLVNLSEYLRSIYICYHIYYLIISFEIGSSPSHFAQDFSRGIIWAWGSCLSIILCFSVFIFLCLCDFLDYLEIQSFSKCSLSICYLLSTSTHWGYIYQWEK